MVELSIQFGNGLVVGSNSARRCKRKLEEPVVR